MPTKVSFPATNFREALARPGQFQSPATGRFLASHWAVDADAEAGHRLMFK